jgi:two-component system chemotaxis response regulator CheB
MANRVECIAIGISTGGPPALSSILAALEPPLPPIVIVQHMPPKFTQPLAMRLDSLSKLTVHEAAEGDALLPNHVFIAPGGRHTCIARHGNAVRIRICDGEPVSGHKPSIDVMMAGVAEVFGRHALALIMTGMGHDGVEGCRAIHAAGGYVLGQDEASSDVYGMNKIAFTRGHVHRQFSLATAAETILECIRGTAKAGRQ